MEGLGQALPLLASLHHHLPCSFIAYYFQVPAVKVSEMERPTQHTVTCERKIFFIEELCRMWNGKLEGESSCLQLQIQRDPLSAFYECRDFYTKLTTFGLENCIFATEGTLIL